MIDYIGSNLEALENKYTRRYGLDRYEYNISMEAARLEVTGFRFLG